MNSPDYGPHGHGSAGPVPHHHHPLSDLPCHNGNHDQVSANPVQRHVFATLYVDPAGLLTLTPWMNLDAARDHAEDRRGVVVAFPIICDYATGPSMWSSGSWPAGKQTPQELIDAAGRHAEAQERARQIAAHRDRDPLSVDPPAAHRDPQPTKGFTFFQPPAGFGPGEGPPASAVDDTRAPRVRPPFMYDPQDGAGVPFQVTEVQR